MTAAEEARENNSKTLKYLILFTLKPELKDALNFKLIKTAHIIADKKKDTITSCGVGMDAYTGEEKNADCPNVLELSKHPNYENVFIGMFVDQIKDFKELLIADLKFEFFDDKDAKGKIIISKHVNTCISYIKKDGTVGEENFRSEF
ncbi:MAG TPA: hypothetical protein VNX01_01650 [Bacteroidia bacterium]|jgi:hypothetical protein|nr:hypothetical protein [Bacteroidia bacterium]